MNKFELIDLLKSLELDERLVELIFRLDEKSLFDVDQMFDIVSTLTSISKDDIENKAKAKAFESLKDDYEKLDREVKELVNQYNSLSN